MNLIPDKTIAGVITSPPYNLLNTTGHGNGGKWPNAELLNGYDGHDDNMDDHEYIAWQRKCLGQMIRVLRDDGVIFYNHKWRVQGGKLQDRREIVNGHSLPVRQIIIWARQGGINHNRGYFLPTYEVIYMIAGPNFKLAEAGRQYTDIWQIPQERGNPHPAPFPLELPRRCIQSIDDGIILDPFIGSGTTAIAAIELRRQWIGIEKSQKYCNIATERICGWKMPSLPLLPTER
jgi:site-specific DNA-methyltransferase (adenine-specific)